MFAALTDLKYIAAGDTKIIHSSLFTIHYSFSAAHQNSAFLIPNLISDLRSAHGTYVKTVTAALAEYGFSGCETEEA